MQAWLLSPSSTCETKTDHEEQSVRLIVTQCYQVHIMPFHVNHGNVCSLEYKVNTLSEVNKWVTSIHNVIQSLQDAVKLQQELQQEWKEEYQAVLMGYNTNVPREE
jgi:adenylyl- and sulfurtransferase ThiI